MFELNLNIRHSPLMRTIFIIILLSFKAFAVSETNFEFTYKNVIEPFYNLAQLKEFTGTDDVKIRYKTFINPLSNKCIIILPGRQEPINKYAETIFDLFFPPQFQSMVSLFILDHRGQGFSGRMTNNTQIGHVDDFNDYVTDLEIFTSIVINKYKFCEKKYLLAHSMGGGIGLGFILKNPKYFEAAAFSAPMFDIITKPYPRPIAKSIVGSAVLMGNGKKYAIGQGNLNVDAPFETNITTHSSSRFKMAMDIYKNFPETQIGGVSNRWVYETLKFTGQLKKNAKKVEIPLYIFQAGNDSFVKNKAQDKVEREAVLVKKFIHENAKHELLMESDSIRDQVIKNVREMIDLY